MRKYSFCVYDSMHAGASQSWNCTAAWGFWHIACVVCVGKPGRGCYFCSPNRVLNLGLNPWKWLYASPKLMYKYSMTISPRDSDERMFQGSGVPAFDRLFALLRLPWLHLVPSPNLLSCAWWVEFCKEYVVDGGINWVPRFRLERPQSDDPTG